MGVDLTICPDTWNEMERGRTPLLHQRLDFERQRSLWSVIRAVPQRRVASARWYGDNGIETITTDPYGDPLRCCRAADLAESMESLGGDLLEENRDILAYLRAIDPDHLILLYWH